MKKHLLSWLIVLMSFSAIQAANRATTLQQTNPKPNIESASIQERRQFKENLNEKYSGRDFTYIEEETKKEETEDKKSNSSSGKAFIDLLKGIGTILPYLLILFVVFILVKSFIGEDFDFWNKSKSKIAQGAEFSTEEEVDLIDRTGYEKALQNAIAAKNFRLATRFYYLILLQRLNEKELIQYHKDKTNSQYLFELSQASQRKHFTYLVYLYDYVWYGEFPINEVEFEQVTNSYQDFFKTL